MTRCFNDFFSQNEIINYLSRQRAKLAKKRSKDHIMSTISTKNKYHKLVKYQDDRNIINTIMPPRRLWVRPSKEKRYRDEQKLNTIEKNKKAIYSTINKHIQGSFKHKYLDELKKFIIDINISINDKAFTFQSLYIRPEPKEKGSSTCRPIANFLLKDNLINCLTNKYLVHYFDDLFYENSFAFRASRQMNDEKRVPNHHDAFKMIINYLKNNTENEIFVAECDIQKFYDTVNHNIAIKQFKKLCLYKQFKEKCDKRAKRIFYKYLQCYNFYEDVFSLDQKYFDKFEIKNGNFKWIEKNELKKFYKNTNQLKSIGVPQGGALSGIIANIVLDYIDKKIMKLKDKNLLYIRYCDDMIMMHTDKKKCEVALETYKKSLNRLKLFPHPIINNEYGKKFWAEKSKGPYKWSKDNIPWIGFVGYEINRNGEIRVRKRSLKKEMNKQYELIMEIISAISDNNLKVPKGTIIESAYNRLNGMAVGRIELWNYINYKNDMCWVNGFQLINKNKYSSLQLKLLDESKNRYIQKLIKYLEKIDDSNIKRRCNDNNRQYIFYGKPFSYFYQMLKKIGANHAIS
jgi:hypothetical protein